MSGKRIDMGELYERAKEASRVVVVGSPGTSYGLEDVMPTDVWLSVAGSGLASLVPVHATLNGCIEGLHARKVAAADVEQVDGPPPPAGTAITADDLRTARSWLADSLAIDIDEAGRQEMIDREAIDRGWDGDPERITSLVLALVMIAGAAADR